MGTRVAPFGVVGFVPRKLGGTHGHVDLVLVELRDVVFEPRGAEKVLHGFGGTFSVTPRGTGRAQALWVCCFSNYFATVVSKSLVSHSLPALPGRIVGRKLRAISGSLEFRIQLLAFPKITQQISDTTAVQLYSCTAVGIPSQAFRKRESTGFEVQ